MNQKSKQVLSQAQQDQLRQLSLEIDVLENQIENILREQTQLVGSYNSSIYISNRFAQTGIRLVHDVGN